MRAFHLVYGYSSSQISEYQHTIIQTPSFVLDIAIWMALSMMVFFSQCQSKLFIRKYIKMEKRALTFNRISWGRWGEQGAEELSRFLSRLLSFREVLSDLETNSVMPFQILKSFAILYTTWKTFN